MLRWKKDLKRVQDKNKKKVWFLTKTYVQRKK
jgi:hypothetical protein